MADITTIETYDQAAADYAKDWQQQPAPEDMYSLLLKYFTNGITADIGCGSGRDAGWLSRKGFEVAGFDASAGLLQEARLTYPDITFKIAALPELKEISVNTYQNVLCETVIMHLEVLQISLAVQRLRDILKPGGTLYLSWRITEGETIRDQAGRLYSAFEKELVLDRFTADEILFNQEEISESSGKKVHRLIVRKR